MAFLHGNRKANSINYVFKHDNKNKTKQKTNTRITTNGVDYFRMHSPNTEHGMYLSFKDF
jgi:hypothetical protein